MATATTLALAISAALGRPAPPSATTERPSNESPATERSTCTAPSIIAPRLAAPPPHDRAARLSTKNRRTARIFVGFGSGLLGLTYLGATLAAATNIDEVHEDGVVEPHERDELKLARRMAVPVVGPFIAAPLGSSKGEKAALVGHGLLQSLAVAYLVGGGVMLARDRRARRLELAAGLGPSGGTVALRGRF